jgi:Na+-transporting NADH:ubiquinone oxidoreductase subunit C
MSNNFKTLLFAAIMCVVCSLLLTAAATGLKPLQQRNMAVDRHKNILMVFGLLEDNSGVPAQQVEQLYEKYIRHLWVDTNGRVVEEAPAGGQRLSLYLHVDQAMLKGYAVPISTRGLWGPIHGYLAIDNDGVTVKGFAVYQHQETPGLGGEIESQWFRKNFEGKKILNAAGEFASISIAKGSAADLVPLPKQTNYVDGISGATMTGKFLTAGLKEILEEYEPVAIKFRQQAAPYAQTLESWNP